MRAPISKIDASADARNSVAAAQKTEIHSFKPTP
jgi:hypothetical protein